jgi:hypothetical protein
MYAAFPGRGSGVYKTHTIPIGDTSSFTPFFTLLFTREKSCEENRETVVNHQREPT